MNPSTFPVALDPESIQILHDLNPWWTSTKRRPAPPYRRRGVDAILKRMMERKGLLEVIRGPRQVGKTTAIQQIVEALLSRAVRPSDILFVRFDQEVLREIPGSLITITRWFEREIRKRNLGVGAPAYLFLDEIHKLTRWDEDVKHIYDTFAPRILLTGSSSVLVARGGRESLAGRILTTEMPTFQFREILEAFSKIADRLPPWLEFDRLFSQRDPRAIFHDLCALRPQQRLSLRRHLERYYNRGGYPRLHNGEVGDDRWADYLTETIFERVLGVDVPDLFPIENPQLLRWIYVEVARATGQEIAQNRLAEDANVKGFQTSQPVVGKYLHYLTDALLLREFRRYPLVKRSSARTPSKFTLTDLGARNAVFRGAPSLWESSPDHVGPLIETLAQSVIRGASVSVHFWRDYQKPTDRRTPLREVDFVAESRAGDLIPIEVKFRKTINTADLSGLTTFLDRHSSRFGLLITRDRYQWIPDHKILCVPLLEFMLAF